MRVLVTGHKGYIGTAMVPMLRRAGHDVLGLDSDLYRNSTYGTGLPEVPEIIKDIRDVEKTDIEGVDGIIHLCQGCAGMAEQRELHGKAQTIGSAAPACHKILVRSRERVMTGQGVRIAGHAQQQPAFLVCQQLSARQDHPPMSQNSSS